MNSKTTKATKTTPKAAPKKTAKAKVTPKATKTKTAPKKSAKVKVTPKVAQAAPVPAPTSKGFFRGMAAMGSLILLVWMAMNVPEGIDLNPLHIIAEAQAAPIPPELRAFRVSVDVPAGNSPSTGQIQQMCNTIGAREWTTVDFDFIEGNDINALNSLWSDKAPGTLTFYVTAPITDQVELEQILFEFGNLQ